MYVNHGGDFSTGFVTANNTLDMRINVRTMACDNGWWTTKPTARRYLDDFAASCLEQE